MSNTSSDLAKLCDIIDKADMAYYRPGMAPLITDGEYDKYKNELRLLDNNNPRLTRVGIPYSAEELRTKVAHNIPMGSLDNTDNGISGVYEWVEMLEKTLGYIPELFVSLKIDGASVCATYDNGKLIRVATRGNGEVGDDITINGMNFKNLPTILHQSSSVDIRGEAVLYKEDFLEICEREKIPTENRSNPRNVGNGILGRDDGKDSNRIQLLAFNIEGENLKTEKDKIVRLSELGFQPVPHKVCAGIKELVEFYNEVAAKRDKLPCEIDGIVVVINAISDQQVFVTEDIKTRLRPKYARAIKFPHKSNTTKLLDVLLSVGHTGAIIPTAVLEEVRVGGVNVTHALLNNWDEIARLDIAIGDTVEVVLAGDIIPKITRKISNGDNRTLIIEPTKCPACGQDANRNFRGKIGAVTFCSNADCDAAKMAKINKWIGTSKSGVGILGIGDTILQALWDSRLINDPADLYSLTVETIQDIKLDGDMRIGKSRAVQIIKNIAGKKILQLPVFLGSLGIDLLGKRRAKMIIDASNGKLSKVTDWLNVDLLSSIELPGFGDTIRESIVSGIKDNIGLIHKLLEVGVSIEYEKSNTVTSASAETVAKEPVRSRPFDGYSFCLTGTRSHIDDIERLGGTIKSGVSKGLTFLVQADPLSTSNKTKKAEEYGTSIISIDYLKDAIDGKVVLEPLSLN